MEIKTMEYRSQFLKLIAERGFIDAISGPLALDSKLCAGPVVGYQGFDATAKSLHVGNLLGVMLLFWFQKTGNKPIVLIGGGTTLVGDPSGKDLTRPMLDADIVAQNALSIKSVFSKFLNFGDSPTDAVLVNNADWLGNLKISDFLQETASVSLNELLHRRTFSSRLQQGSEITALEFSYPIIQAYDFLHLKRNYNCTLQFGGSDQWTNIIAGVNLGRKNAEDLFALVTPLVTMSDGRKMGKSIQGAVWIGENLQTAQAYHQFWMSTTRDDVEKFLLLYTDIEFSEVKRLVSNDNSMLSMSKEILAERATNLLFNNR